MHIYEIISAGRYLLYRFPPGGNELKSVLFGIVRDSTVDKLPVVPYQRLCWVSMDLKPTCNPFTLFRIDDYQRNYRYLPLFFCRPGTPKIRPDTPNRVTVAIKPAKQAKTHRKNDRRHLEKLTQP